MKRMKPAHKAIAAGVILVWIVVAAAILFMLHSQSELECARFCRERCDDSDRKTTDERMRTCMHRCAKAADRAPSKLRKGLLRECRTRCVHAAQANNEAEHEAEETAADCACDCD